MSRELDVDRALELFNATVTLVDPVRLRAWADLGLTVPTLKVLFLLREQPGMPAGLLAQKLGVTPSTITGLVDRLVTQDLVRRDEDPRDRRLVRNYLTTQGGSTVGDIQRQARDLVSQVIAELDDTQLERLCCALEDLIEASRRVETRAPVGV
jgi:DNA-binding MarR family transcriptional regulator